MEAVVPCAAGGLTALAVWEALGVLTTPAVGRGASTPDGAGALVAAIASGAGDLLPAALVEARAVKMAAGEVARLMAPLLGREIAGARPRAGLLFAASLGVAALGALVSSSVLGAVLGAVAVPMWGAVRASRRERERATLLSTAMPEAFHALSISLGSGHSLGQALRFVGNHAQEPIHSEFMRVSFAMSCGVAASEALDALLLRLPAPGLDLVALALKVSQRTGAPLKDLLAQASDMVGERVELARRLEVKTAQARMSARLVTLMPLVLIALLALLSADFRAGLATPTGIASVAVALVLDACAWVAIKRVMEVDP